MRKKNSFKDVSAWYVFVVWCSVGMAMIEGEA